MIIFYHFLSACYPCYFVNLCEKVVITVLHTLKFVIRTQCVDCVNPLPASLFWRFFQQHSWECYLYIVFWFAHHRYYELWAGSPFSTFCICWFQLKDSVCVRMHGGDGLGVGMERLCTYHSLCDCAVFILPEAFVHF